MSYAVPEAWVPGYALQQGPEVTRLDLRFTGFREEDAAPAWIRVDGFPPEEPELRGAFSRVYDTTAELDHPDLPAVLDFGPTLIPGRPFIAFQLDTSRPAWSDVPDISWNDLVLLLVEIHWLALENGSAGVLFPTPELDRVRKGERVEGRRIPVREFLCEPRDGIGSVSSFRGLLEARDWSAFTAPELRGPERNQRVALRPAVCYRLAAQLFYLQHGEVPGPVERTQTAFDGDEREQEWLGIPGLGKLARKALRSAPARRPPLEAFVSPPAGGAALDDTVIR